MNWDEASKAITLSLRKAVFSPHIHDGDLWMYTLYQNGIQIDAFNPIPDYWDEDITDQEREANKGNAEIISRCIAGLQPGDIKNYLVVWELDSDESVKAYVDDEFSCGIDWQMLDFMKKASIAISPR